MTVHLRFAWCCLITLGLLASSGEAQAQVAAAMDGSTVGGTLMRPTSAPPTWYVGRQLREPVVLALDGVNDAATCSTVRVEFSVSGKGLASPANAPGSWDGSECSVSVSWTLSDEVGRQHLTASQVGVSSAPVVVEALGRQGARLFFGAAYTPREEAYSVVGTRDDGTLSVEQVEAKPAFRPVMGVDFAPWPSWERIRLAVGTGARDFDRQFYFGFSVMQSLVFGQPSEGSTVDLHAGIQLTRRDVAVTGARCGGAGVCADSDLRFSGLALFIAVDGASAFRGLAGTILR